MVLVSLVYTFCRYSSRLCISFFILLFAQRPHYLLWTLYLSFEIEVIVHICPFERYDESRAKPKLWSTFRNALIAYANFNPSRMRGLFLHIKWFHQKRSGCDVLTHYLFPQQRECSIAFYFLSFSNSPWSCASL